MNIRELEKTALQKVTDIHGGKLMKHGFVRFGHRTDRQIYVNGSLAYLGRKDPNLDRLEGILRFGVVSSERAKKEEIGYSPNWVEPTKGNKVSLVKEGASVAFALRAGLDLAIQTEVYGPRGVVPAEDIIVILIDGGLPTTPDRRFAEEVLIEDRVPVELLRGVAVLDGCLGPHLPTSPGIDSFINYASSTPEGRVRRVVDAIAAAYKDWPAMALPIYGGLSGDLLWPKVLRHATIKEQSYAV